MKLSELHLHKFARVDGTMETMFTAERGWAIEVRPDLGGVIIGRANRDDASKRDQQWIPFSAILNGKPVEVPQKAGK